MNEAISKREKTANKFYYVSRLVSLLSVFMMFLPAVNPGRFSALISKNLSVSYDSLISGAGRAIRQGWVSQSAYTFIFVGSMLICIGIAVCAGGSCVSLGNLKMKNLSNIISLAGSAFEGAGILLYCQEQPEQIRWRCRRSTDCFSCFFHSQCWHSYSVICHCLDGDTHSSIILQVELFQQIIL